jgi:LPXTG-motif cell wall-anchored protein
VNHTHLPGRLLAGAASLAIGAAGALAFAAPASAQDTFSYTAEAISERGTTVSGSAECDPDAGTWAIIWTVTNTSPSEVATIIEPDAAVAGFTHNDAFQPGEAKNGTQTLPGGTASATFAATLRWWSEAAGEELLTGSATVELGDCPPKEPEPEEPEEPEPPAEPIDPAIITFRTCELLGFIIDNSLGNQTATVTFTPNQAVTHGHAAGFSYTVDDGNKVEIIAAEGAGIHTVLGEADSSNPVALGPFAAGADLHTHAFEAAAGLTITVALTVDGEPGELADPEVSWSAEGLDCPAEDGDDGQGGELPTTGSSTMLIASGAGLLLVLGGGLYLAAHRRRVSFTA